MVEVTSTTLSFGQTFLQMVEGSLKVCEMLLKFRITKGFEGNQGKGQIKSDFWAKLINSHSYCSEQYGLENFKFCKSEGSVSIVQKYCRRSLNHSLMQDYTFLLLSSFPPFAFPLHNPSDNTSTNQGSFLPEVSYIILVKH